MDFTEVDRIMAAHNFIGDPAFDNVNIGVEPIQCYNGCPLGLYFPSEEWNPGVRATVPGGTIVIPPEGSEATLLHELGHRHGHYYYDDLSEMYAEDFRRIFQPKDNVRLYMGSDFNRLPEMGKVFGEGEKGAVEVAFRRPLTPGELYSIESQLHVVGREMFQCECIECGYYKESYAHCRDFPCPRCGGQMRRFERPGPGQPRMYHGNSEVPWIRLEFTKSVDWTMIIGASLASLVAVTMIATGYAIYKLSKEIPWIVPLTIAGTAAFFLLKAASKQEWAMERIRELR